MNTTSKIGQLVSSIQAFLSAVPGSLKNHLNAEELIRIATTALTAGGGVYGVLQAIILGAGTIFPAPGDAALAAALLTTILEVLRRLGHGTAPGPQIAPGGTAK